MKSLKNQVDECLNFSLFETVEISVKYSNNQLINQAIETINFNSIDYIIYEVISLIEICNFSYKLKVSNELAIDKMTDYIYDKVLIELMKV